MDEDPQFIRRADMKEKLTLKDKELLHSIDRFNVLTVSQIAALTNRRRQVIRRCIRTLSEKGLIKSIQRPYTNHKGRPEDIIRMTAAGRNHLLNTMDHQIDSLSKTGSDFPEPIEFNCLDHDLLMNWALIHFMYIERAIPCLEFLTLDQSHDHPIGRRKLFVPNPDGISEPIELIPDSVVAFHHKDKKKTLLFFLEVDMGTETVSSPNHNPDIRRKLVHYQMLFRSAHYRIFEKDLKNKPVGFRLLFLTSTTARLNQLGTFVREAAPFDFIWMTDQDSMFSKGLSSLIWYVGGKMNQPTRSILGTTLAADTTVLDKIGQ